MQYFILIRLNVSLPLKLKYNFIVPNRNFVLHASSSIHSTLNLIMRIKYFIQIVKTYTVLKATTKSSHTTRLTCWSDNAAVKKWSVLNTSTFYSIFGKKANSLEDSDDPSYILNLQKNKINVIRVAKNIYFYYAVVVFL